MKYKDILIMARALRKNQTPAEKIFWEKTRGKKILGLRFQRQYIIEHSEIFGISSFFIVDFYCHAKLLVIEIDGGIHDQQKEYDKNRENILIAMGYKILRFKNEEVITDWDKVESILKEWCLD